MCLLAGCGGPEPQSPSSTATLECPAPIGPLQRENCTDVGEDFGALSVAGALKLAGTGPDADQRIEAIRAAGALANALKEERLELCAQYDACKVAPAEHAARDRALSDLMNALIKLWDGRQFGQPDGVARFHQSVLALSVRLGGKRAPSGPAPVAPAAAPARAHVVGADKLVRIESPALSFKGEAGSVTVAAQDQASHDALRGTADALELLPSHRYQIRVLGGYAPAAPPLIHPGDELVARVKYRTTEPAELYVALRSLEDPEALDSTTSWKLAAKESGSKEAAFTAAPGASGFYLAVGARTAGPIDLDDVELVRSGKPIAAARFEIDEPAVPRGAELHEPLLQTSCTPSATKPLAGNRSLRCNADAPGRQSAVKGDFVTLGMPAGHLFIAVRGSTGDRALLRTLSLEGGRTLDATLAEKADLIIGLAGPGTATIRSVEVSSPP